VELVWAFKELFTAHDSPNVAENDGTFREENGLRVGVGR
jgi:hypothetical protein